MMKWIDIKEFPQGLERDCYLLVKHKCLMSDSPFDFHIFKYIKNENKLYKEWMNDGVFHNTEKDIDRLKIFFEAYTEITGIDFLLFEPYNIVKEV